MNIDRARRVLDVATFLLKLGRERVDEAKRLVKAGDTAEVELLLNESDLLRDGYDEIMASYKKEFSK